MQSLIFFNKEGDNLNFTYNQDQERWEGDLLFHENSDDTFKTIGLYTFEKIKTFEYENIGNLKLKKFQLFNEYRFRFDGNSNFTQPIQKIELPNLDPTFYSKWIYGENFESKFPKGSQIKFDDLLFEFSNPIQTYTVVATKKNAILILSNIDNQNFDVDYGRYLGLTTSYENKTISGINSIGFYYYINQEFKENYSDWSEPDFYDRFYNKRKLNIINTEKNDGIVTVKNKDLFDRVYYKYQFEKSIFTQSSDFSIKLILKTEAPIVYKGGVKAEGNRLYFNGVIPVVFKPGTTFTINTSTLNYNFITVGNIPTFLGNTNQTYYAEESQVIWDNLIYQCIQSHTWSATSSIDPSNPDYWSRPKFLPTDSELVDEELFYTEIHLSNNVLLYNQTFTQSSAVTLASIIEKYKDEFKLFDLDLYYEDASLHVDLIYPTDYCLVEFYLSTTGTKIYSSKETIYEHVVETKEILKTELNENINENFKYNIVFTDLDEFGLRITINKQIYQQEILWVYESSKVNMGRTIDKTLRRWYERWWLQLFVLGIKSRVGFIGGANSQYYNSISLSSVYPNVPIDFIVDVGDTADFFIEHSEVAFKEISNFISLNINNRDYGIKSTLSNSNVNQIFDIPTTLSNWVDEYSEELLDFGILVVSVGNTLIFRVRTQYQRLRYTIQVGKSGLPAEEIYVVKSKIFGKFGALITSNEIFLPKTEVDIPVLGTSESVPTIIATWSFENQDFAVGQICGINNTIYPWNNQEYNLITLDPQSLILDYRGPFWSTIDPKCEVSAYAISGFDSGFGATGCIVLTQSVDLGGEFAKQEYAKSFLISFGTTNSYTGQQLEITANRNVQDVIYTSINENLYLLGDSLTVMDANNLVITDIISLPGITGSLQVGINPINDLIYCLSKGGLYIVDPRLNILQTSITFSVSNFPYKFEINTTNGDFYLIYESSLLCQIWEYTNYTSSPNYNLFFDDSILDIKFNSDENDMYFAIADNTIKRVDGDTRQVSESYNYTSLTAPLFYDQSESSLYIFDSSGLQKINNGQQISFGSILPESINYFVYNNVLEQLVISQTSRFSAYRTDGSLVSNVFTSDPGPLEVNQYDGDTYQASGSYLKVLDTLEGKYKWSERFEGDIKKLIYNPARNSIIGIIPSIPSLLERSSLVELKVTLGSLLSEGSIPPVQAEEDVLYGSLSPTYQKREDTWLKVREFIRKPKSNYNDGVPVDLVWKWVDDQTPDIFLYDFTGDQLITTSSYSYTGPKPLPKICLNNTPNRDISKINIPEFQQTIFDTIVKRLEFIDTEIDFYSDPEPIEIFIGYNSKQEGQVYSNLKLYKRESIEFNITTTPTNNDIIQFLNRTDGFVGININQASDLNFYTDNSGTERGFKPGQIIQIFLSDVTNTKNKYISLNNGIKLKIRYVFNKSLVCDIVEGTLVDEFTVIDDYPKLNRTTYLSLKLKTIDKEIGSFNVYGQTQIEDIRYKIELGNSGQLISPNDIFIFKENDIVEQGIDWTYLNKKRKELLMVRDQIYSYIGSYKAIINAINYFGYNDLELYEYYRNINTESKDYQKLFKVEIPDIFDNTVEGWTPNDFIKHTLPNPNFEDTNLFNLTFRITDKEGNNVLSYSLFEILIKLQGLKLWLQKNVIPLTHRILDITGRADFTGITTIQHRNFDTRIIKIEQNFSPYDFKLNEAYLMPINSGSTVYSCIIDFFTAEQSFSSVCFELKIRTYQTYKEWQPFKIYSKGDKVSYFQQVYESAIDNNRLRNPRKFDGAKDWDPLTNYNLGDYTSYYRDIYQYIGTQSSYEYYGDQTPPSPVSDIKLNQAFAKWTIMTEWKKSDYLPVQSLTEFRTATHSYIFTVDSNLDPFVLIEVTSDNGYGLNYTNKKTYEIRGTKDLIDDPGKPDPMGPFTPIIRVETTNLSFVPTITSERGSVDGLLKNQVTEFLVNSDKNISEWIIADVVLQNCIVYISIEKDSQNSANIKIVVDSNSKNGTFSFRVKGFVPGGFEGETTTITGTVGVPYGYGGFGIGLGLL